VEDVDVFKIISKVKAITLVLGGVKTMTIAMLLRNKIKSYT